MPTRSCRSDALVISTVLQDGPKKDNAAKVNPGKPVNPKVASPKSVPAVKSVKVDPAKPAVKK